MRVVLAIGAHPDDIELGCAGSLVLHRAKGDKVYLLVLTRGEASGNAKYAGPRAEVREKECRKSAKILGVKDVYFGGLKDTMVPDGRETVDVIEDVLNQVRPDIVYAPSGKDTHQDHRKTGHAVLSACRRVRIVLLYEGASTQRDFSPQVFVDIKPSFRTKLRAIRVFGSQMTFQNGGYAKAVKAVEGLAKYRGYQAGVEVAEAFEVGKFIYEI
jgi:LmbE family N-acetylglucosaminyl deacetylase